MKRDNVDVDQLKVVEADVRACMLVHAGPGTGKTEVSAQRLARLVQAGIRPAEILVLSFSRSAVRTLTRRIEMAETGSVDVIEELRHLTIRTFDAWAFRVLRQLGVPPSDLLKTSYEQNIQLLIDRITGEERDTVRGLLEGIRHIIIDEFQDLPGVRGRLVLALLDMVAPPGSAMVGFTVLGDPAQGIYEFATRDGETVSSTSQGSWAELRRIFGSSLVEITLRTNYRASTGLATATEELREVLLGEISSEEKLTALRAYVSALPAATAPLSPEWLKFLPPGQIAILTRTNGQAVRVAKALLGNAVEGPDVQVNLQLAGHVSVVPGWIAALLSPLRAETLLHSKFDQIYALWLAKSGQVNALALGLPDAQTAWQRLVRAADLPVSTSSLPINELRKRLDWPDSFPDDQSPGDGRIYITTIHQAKGMEFDYVCLLDRHEEEEKRDESALEEASICFVGITRAKLSLGVIPGGHIFKPPVRREFRSKRTRLTHWWSGWVNVEIGVSGDIEVAGFVDERVLGSSDEIAGVQHLLMTEASSLNGHKVILCKVRESEDSPNAVYDIHLQDGSAPGRKLGRMSQQLTWDLLDLLHKKGYSLPSRIMNLRISSVVTMAGPAEVHPSIPEPYRSSRLWLGINVSGTGDFKPFKGISKQ